MNAKDGYPEISTLGHAVKEKVSGAPTRDAGYSGGPQQWSCEECRHLMRWSPQGRCRNAARYSGLFCVVLDEYLDSVDDCICNGEQMEEL